tara:strand:+ start:42 stop:1628 length:1587 start_codon:yes stop_codon:yes gene_type:complete
MTILNSNNNIRFNNIESNEEEEEEIFPNIDDSARTYMIQQLSQMLPTESTKNINKKKVLLKYYYDNHSNCHNNYQESIKLIEEIVCEIKLIDHDRGIYNNTTPLHFVLENGYLEIAEILIEEGKYNNVRDTWIIGCTYEVHMEDYNEECDNFIESLGTDDINYIETNWNDNYYNYEYENDGDTPINLACKLGFLNIVKLLMDKEVNMEYRDLMNRHPIHSASINGHVEIVDYLISKNTKFKDIKISDEWFGDDSEETIYFSPLHFACFKGHIEVVKILVEKYDCNIEGEAYNSPLVYAILNNHTQVAKYLIKQGADLENTCDDEEGLKPIHAACYKRNIEMVKYLLNLDKVTVNSLDKENKKPIYYVCRNDNYNTNPVDENTSEIIKILIGNGCDINCSNYPEEPLVTAYKFMNYKAIRALILNGANYDCICNDSIKILDRPLNGRYEYNEKKILYRIKKLKEFVRKEINWSRRKLLVLNRPYNDYETNNDHSLSALGNIITAEPDDNDPNSRDNILYQLKIKLARFI